MAKLSVGIGSTGRTEYIYLTDYTSSSGAGKTGIAYNTSGLLGHYVRNAGTATTITLASQTVTGAWVSGGWVEVDQSRMPGVYRVDLPDTVFASGSDKAIVLIRGVSNTAPVALEYQLTALNLNTFTESSIANTVWTNVTRTITGGTITTNNDKNGYTITAGIVTSVSNPVDITTNSMSGIANTVWTNVTRTLSATGISAYDVWNFNNRTLSATGLSAYDVWNYTDRIITGGTGVSITQAFPDNFEFMLITNTGRIYLNKADIEKIRA